MLTAMKSPRRWFTLLPLVVALTACGARVFSGGALAKPPDHAKGGGNGGGSGDDDDGASTAAYTLTELPGFDGARSDANAISQVNGDGVAFVTGDAQASDGDFHATVWEVSAAGDLFDIAEIPPSGDARENLGTAANADAIVAGHTVGRLASDGITFIQPDAFVDIPGVGQSELPGFAKESETKVHAINSFGDVVGLAVDADGNDHGVLWHVDTDGSVIGPIDLGDFIPFDINGSGEMAGQIGQMTIPPANSSPAIAWFDENDQLQVMEIGLLDGSHAGGRAEALNDNGLVVGRSVDPDGLGHAFLWTPDGMVALGSLDKGEYSGAFDINNAAEVVGYSDTGKSVTAVLWIDGTIFELHDSIDVKHVWLNGAEGINDAGQITGLGCFGKGNDCRMHGYLLMPNAP